MRPWKNSNLLPCRRGQALNKIGLDAHDTSELSPARINDYPIARMWRNARVQRTYGGSNEIMKLLIARSL